MSPSHGHRPRDVWPRVIIRQFKILIAETEDVLYLRIEAHPRQGARCAGKLETDLFKVVEVDVRIAQCVDEVTCPQACDLCHHLEQQGIGGDVEGHAQESVCTALVHLQAEAPVGHVKLEEQVARGQVHSSEVGHIPCADDDAA